MRAVPAFLLLAVLGAASAAEHPLLAGALAFSPPHGDEVVLAHPESRSFEYRLGDPENGHYMAYSVREYLEHGDYALDQQLRTRLDDLDSSRRLGDEVVALGAAILGPTVSLVVASEHVGEDIARDSRREWYADVVIDGRHCAIQATFRLGEAAMTAKDAAAADDQMDAFLFSFTGKGGIRPFGRHATHDALAKKAPPPAPMMRHPPETLALFDGALTVDLPFGAISRREDARCRNVYISARAEGDRELLYDINEWRRPVGETIAKLVAMHLDTAFKNRGLGNDVTPLGAAAVGPAACVVVLAEHYSNRPFGNARRVWFADYLEDHRRCQLQLTYMTAGNAVPAAEIAASDATVTQLLASFRTADGRRPFGEDAVTEALQHQPEMPVQKK